MDLPTPKRRWFRFSLRTLLILVTLFCVWLGYQVNWIRQRRAFIAETGARLAEIGGIDFQSAAVVAPWSLGMFRERGHHAVMVRAEGQGPGVLTSEDVRLMHRALRLFPELQMVIAIHHDPNGAPTAPETWLVNDIPAL